MTVIISLQQFNILLLKRHVVAIFTKGIATASNTALIILFRILFSPITFLIENFYIASFISFSKTLWLIFINRGRSWLLISYKSTQYIPRKNLSISIFIFSLLLFVYWSCSVWRSVGKQGSLSISPTALLFYFNRRQRPQLYSLVESKVVFFQELALAVSIFFLYCFLKPILQGLIALIVVGWTYYVILSLHPLCVYKQLCHFQ